MYLLFCCKMHSRRRRHSLMRDLPPRMAADGSPTTTVFCCCSSRLWTASVFLSFDNRCCRFYSATSPEFNIRYGAEPVWTPDWFCSISYAEIPVAFVESEIRLLANFRQVASLFVIKTINIKLADVFRTKQHWRLKYAKKSCKLVRAYWRCGQ